MTSAAPARERTWRTTRTVGKLMFCTLRHEWVPAMCLVLSLGAVLAPLLLMLGLKYGTISTLRSRLLRDPRNLEFRPTTSEPVDSSVVAALKAIPGVAFVMPTTRLLGATVTLLAGESAAGIDLQPTGPGDPLLLVNGSMPPQRGEIVLSAAAAAKLGGIHAGEEVTLEATRMDGGIQKARTRLRVASVLPPEATGLATAFVPLSLQESVEQFKDGEAVPELGWPGRLPTATPQYDGVAVLTPTELPPQTVTRLCLETGFASQRKLTEAEKTLICPGPEGRKKSAVLCFNPGAPQSESVVALAEDVLRGHEAAVLPWTHPLEATVELPGSGGKLCLTLSGQSRLPDKTAWRNAPESSHLPVLIVPAAVPEGGALLTVVSGTHSLRLPVELRVDGTLGSLPEARSSVQLTGVLRLLDRRQLIWDEGSKTILLGRRTHSGFRLYARELEDVAQVQATLEARGIRCVSEMAQVTRIQRLDRDLSLIFQLVATFGIGGACAALALSLYGAVNRRRRDYGMLRTLGLRRRWIVALPLLEGLVLVLLAFALGAACFHVVASVINRLFAAEVGGDAFCLIPLQVLGLVCALACGLGLLASAGAAIRLTTVSPADAIRST